MATTLQPAATSSPLQAAWTTAAAAQQAGTQPVEAMFDIFDQFPPGLPPGAGFLDMATIVGYVWADRYWESGLFIQMDPGLLGQDLVSGMGWDLNDCQTAATTAFQTWAGIVMRKNSTDASTEIPFPSSQTYTASPDVLCNGNNTIPFPLLIENWNSTFWNGANPGSVNYLYARGEVVNFPAQISSASVQIYTSDAGFNIPPNQWQHCSPPTAPGTNALTLADGKTTTLNNGDQAAITGAFQWLDPSSAHFCAVGVVTTPFFTNNPLVGFSSSNWNATTWLLYNGAAGWHNLSSQTDRVTILTFHNQDRQAERFAFEAHASGVPAGTKISLSSSDPKHPLTASGVVGPDNSVVVLEGSFAGDYRGKIALEVQVPGRELLPPGGKVEVRMKWLVDRDNPHHLDAVKRHGGAHGGVVRVPMGDYAICGKS